MLLALVKAGVKAGAKAGMAAGHHAAGKSGIPAGHGNQVLLLASLGIIVLAVAAMLFLFLRKRKPPTRQLALSGNAPGMIGSYKILGELGKGGMGTVYLARSAEGVKVALKVPDASVLTSEQSKALFRKEAELCITMDHKNIVRVFEYNDGSWGSVPYIAMEYVSGTPLSSLMKDGKPFAVKRAVPIIQQVLSGLSYAHKMGVVHQDIKPANIMITDGVVKIMDFGIAHDLFAGGKDPGTEGDFIGSPYYMSPEQIGGKDVDYRTDYYSLGILSYQMLTGRLPYEGDNPIQVATKHLTDEPPAMRLYASKLPLKLEKLVLRLMDKNPDRRPFNIGPIREVLRDVMK